MNDSSDSPEPQATPLYDWSGVPGFLQEQDWKRLRNLFERTIGRGFKMAVIETPTPTDRQQLLDWLRPNIEAAGTAEHDIHLPTLLGKPDDEGQLQTTLWQALTETIPPASIANQRTVLIVSGIEDLQYADQQNRFDLLQQFNVQRDLFVRDYPCFWLLLIHPQSRHHWHRVAPDFSDFVALWIESSTSQESIPVATRSDPQLTTHAIGSIGFAAEHWPDPLRAAFDEILLSQYDKALDRIHSFLAVTPDAPDTARNRAIARMLETDVWENRGEPQRALDRLQQEILPVFEQLDANLEVADALDRIASLLAQQGDIDEALKIRRNRILPLCEADGLLRETAITQGKIADVLRIHGELDEALRIRREEELPVYERLGDVRAKAITQGKIADVLQARGELDEALRIRREEELPVYERLGDVRAKAVTQGKIADVLQARGELDEALRIRREEELPVYERLGDVRMVAVTQGRIADVLQARGELDEALRIRREEQLPVYERLGDVRGKAVTQGKIADVLQARGELNEALRIRRAEELPVYQRLGDVRLVAVTKGYVADALQARGELDEALRIYHEEQLPVFQRLGDVRGTLLTKLKIAKLRARRGDVKQAVADVRELLPKVEELGDAQARMWFYEGLAQLVFQRDESLDRRGWCPDYLQKALHLAEDMGLPDDIARLKKAIRDVKRSKAR